MIKALAFSLLMGALLPLAAAAEERPSGPQAEEQWLKALRGSTTYRQGLGDVRSLVEKAYDLGAIAGASHWEDMHEYYDGLARAKGCERGMPFARGPTKACHRVVAPEPALTGRDYHEGMATAVKLAEETSYPELIEEILRVLYDYGYIQGLKHGIHVRNDDIRLAQSYYRACMSRANDAKGEPACAEGSKAWAAETLEHLRKQIEGHSLTRPPEAK
jgi:hypothetical protein